MGMIRVDPTKGRMQAYKTVLHRTVPPRSSIPASVSEGIVVHICFEIGSIVDGLYNSLQSDF